VRRKLMRLINGRRAVHAIRKNGFWFVDIPRTSSSSIKVELARYFGPAHGKANVLEKEHATKQLLPDHLTAIEVQKLVGGTSWSDLFTFTVVRNPWARVLSQFHFYKQTNSIPGDWDFLDYVARRVDATSDTPYFKSPITRYGAADFIVDHDENLLVNCVIRFEDDRQIALRPIADQLGVPSLGTMHLQTASPEGENYRLAYDDRACEQILLRYEKDVRLFAYRF
jgi:hypothetical protein